MSRTILLAYTCVSLAVLGTASSASAYDLSRMDPGPSVESGFFYGSGGVWSPGFGGFDELHQMSLSFGGEFGWRFARILGGEHNLYFVAGLDVSPQVLDPHHFRGRYHTLLWLPAFGVRYQGLCIADGLGCAFFELRFGFAIETAESGSGHDGPSGTFTVLPGFGYRFKFGPLMVGARADLAISEEYDVRSLSWVTLSGLVGVGW